MAPEVEQASQVEAQDLVEGAQEPAVDEAPQVQGEEKQEETPRGRLFAQEDVDRIVKERLERERRKYADYEEIKKRLSEVDSLYEQASKFEARALELEAAVAEHAIRADFLEKALEAGCTDPRLAYLAAQADDLLGSYDPESGEVSEHNIEALRERYPNLFRGSAANIDAGSRSPATSVDINQWLRNELLGR